MKLGGSAGRSNLDNLELGEGEIREVQEMAVADMPQHSLEDVANLHNAKQQHPHPNAHRDAEPAAKSA